MTAVFFCSANEDIAPEYNDAARQIVRAAAARGWKISSGGTTKGTMGVICEEALGCGAFTKGVVPRFMQDVVYPGLTETVWTDSMAERKAAMVADADLAVALPGGIGTLDELFEVYVLAKLGKYSGRVAVLNIGGFYDLLIAMLDHLVDTGMLLPKDRALLVEARSASDIIDLL